MFMQQNQPFGMQSGTNHLSDAIDKCMSEVVQQFVRGGYINQCNAGDFLNQFRQYNQSIAQTVRNAMIQRGAAAVDSQDLLNVVQQHGQELFQMLSRQQQQNIPMQQSMGSSMFSTSPQNVGASRPTAFSFMSAGHMPAQTQPTGFPGMSAPVKPEVVPPKVANVPGPDELLASGNAPHKYTLDEDTTATVKLSSKCKSGPIIDVSKKFTLTDELGNKYNYSKVTSYIKEPSVTRVIDNFVKTNPKLCNGNWISYIDYTTFDLRATKSRPAKNVDLSILDNLEHRDLPAENIISTVLDEIEGRDFTIVSVINELLVAKFNQLSRRFIRTTGTFKERICAETMRDIATIAGMRDPEYGDITFHQRYEDVVLACFKQAVYDIILPTDTPKGYFEAEDIASDLLASRSFVIRQPGICEREMDLSNPEFVSAIKHNFCAFSNSGRIAVCNFIPDDLDTDLETGISIKVGQHTSPIDYLITGVWKSRLPDAIIFNQGGVKLSVLVGTTLDGVTFMTKDRHSTVV